MSAMRVRSASWVFAAQVFGKLVAFPIGILLARALGPSGKGALSVVQLVAQVGVVVLNLGLGSAFTFYAGRREVPGGSALRFSAAFGAALSAALLALWVAVGGWFSADVLNLDDPRLLAVALLMVGPALALNLMYSVVVGSGSVRDATMVINVSFALQFVAYTTLFVLDALSLPVAVIVWAASVVGEATAIAVLGLRVRAGDSVQPGAVALFRRSWRYGLIMWVTNLVGFAALRVDMFLLSSIKGTAAVGVYSVAVTFAELLWFVPNALNAVMLPKVSGEGDAALDVTVRLERVLWPLTLVAGVGLFVVAAPLIPMLYGRDFAAAAIPLALLLPGAVAMALTTMPASYLSGIGKPKLWTRAAAANLVVNVVANVVLIPRFGIAGAAISSAVSYSVAAVWVIFAFVRETGVGLGELLIPRGSDFRDFAQAARAMLSRRTP